MIHHGNSACILVVLTDGIQSEGYLLSTYVLTRQCFPTQFPTRTHFMFCMTVLPGLVFVPEFVCLILINRTNSSLKIQYFLKHRIHFQWTIHHC